MSEPAVPVSRIAWRTLAAWAAWAVLLGLGGALAMRVIELQGRVSDLEREVGRLAAPR